MIILIEFSIINLPVRTDRLGSLGRELRRFGLDIANPKVTIPPAPIAENANGFPSRGVYGNFLSHLNIIEDAYKDKLRNVLVLEDDAIFSHRFRSTPIARTLSNAPWDMCFIGHSLTIEPAVSGLVKSAAPFKWAHCYAVNRGIMPRLIEYMKSVIERPAGHPDGGKMYIDGTYNLFRRHNSDVVSLLAAPSLSVQKGSPSSLNDAHWYDKNPTARILVNAVRGARDECWRCGWLRGTRTDSS